MAAGILGQSTYSGAGGFGASPTTFAQTVYTCPVSANYTVLHIYVNSINAYAESYAGAGAVVTNARILVGGATLVAATASATAVPSISNASVTGKSYSIILGPGESVEASCVVTRPGGGPANQMFTFNYNFFVTGYEG